MCDNNSIDNSSLFHSAPQQQGSSWWQLCQGPSMLLHRQKSPPGSSNVLMAENPANLVDETFKFMSFQKATGSLIWWLHSSFLFSLQNCSPADGTVWALCSLRKRKVQIHTLPPPHVQCTVGYRNVSDMCGFLIVWGLYMLIGWCCV